MRIQGPAGQPPEPPDKQTYLTQSGDTLRSVSVKFNVDPDLLGKLNNIRASFDTPLDAGLELSIPDKIAPGVKDPPEDILESVTSRLNPFDSSGIEAYWGETQGPPWSEEGPVWNEAPPGWTEINPDPDSRLKK